MEEEALKPLSPEEVAAKRSAIETWVASRLKPDLAAAEEARDAVLTQEVEYSILRERLAGVGEEVFHALVPLDSPGGRLFVEAQAPKDALLLVDLGLGVQVELSRSETSAFLARKLPQLEEASERLAAKAQHIAHLIATFDLALKELVVQ